CLSGYPEMCLYRFAAVLAVDKEIAVAVGKLSMDEGNLAIGLAAGEMEVGRDSRLCQRGFNVGRGDDAAFAELRVGLARPQLCHQSVPFAAIATKTWIALGPHPDNRGTALDQGRQSAQRRKRHHV